jgi:hypothetical protein
MPDLQEALLLVQRAYAAAKRRKPDWQRMTASVLKNRLLDYTARSFDPKLYGATDFEDLLLRLAPTVHATPRAGEQTLVEWRGPDPTGELAKQETTSTPVIIMKPPAVAAGRLPDDLWLSIMDYGSRKVYVWDDALGKARVGELGERLPQMPTLAREELSRWRADFVESQRPELQGADLAQTLRWKEQNLGTLHLPKTLQQKWKRYQSRQARSRLQNFFDDHKPAAAPVSATAEQHAADATEVLQPPVDEGAVLEARQRGDALGAGELISGAFAAAPEDIMEQLFARVIVAWASPTHPAPEPKTALPEVIARIDEFSPNNFAVAVVNALLRLKHYQRRSPEHFPDLAFRIQAEVASTYDVEARRSPTDTCQAAVARLEAILAKLSAAVETFARTTPATAKAASIDVLRFAHQAQPMLLAAERQSLRELELLLGGGFRKFCESHERQDAAGVVRRAPELRENIRRNSAAPGDARLLSRVWQNYVAPISEHVASLIEEATRSGEASLLPVLGLSNASTKTDLSSLLQDQLLTFRLINSGRGQALSVAMALAQHDESFELTLVEPRGPFAVAAGTDQLVVLRLTLARQLKRLSPLVRWTCRTAIGDTCTFEEPITVEQQSLAPDWDALLAAPPYSLNPIKRRDRLYGRETTLRQLRLAALAGASTFLWGQKRIGKTSLLQVLASELSALKEVACVVLRMGELTALHEGQIAHRIAARLSEASGSISEVPREEEFGAGLSRLVPFIERLVGEKPTHRFVVVIDEFDDLEPAFYTGERGRQFVKALRSVSEIGVTFFFVGSERMDAIYRRHQADLNKWRNFWLDRINNREDCKAMITQPVGADIEYEPNAVEFIIDYCAGNPFYIHNFCYQVFDRCVQEHRTYVGENDVQIVRHHLLQSLGPTNFAHFWEDNPELDPDVKRRETSENCIALTCIATLGGHYEALEELLEVQDSLPLAAEDRASAKTLRAACERLRGRNVLIQLPGEGGVVIGLPVLREWLAENAIRWLLPVWGAQLAQDRPATAAPPEPRPLISEPAGFLIPEDDLLAVSQKLVYCGRQKDVAEIRQWLRQFDDDNRIEVAFMLLKRIADRGYINEGSRGRALHKVSEMIHARRQELGTGGWRVVRGRLDDLCLTYVDSDLKSGAATARDLHKMMRPGKYAAASEVMSWMRSHVADDSVLAVVDDFAGTGKTLVAGLAAFRAAVAPDVWQRFTERRRIVVYVMFAFPEAITRVQQEFADVEVMAASILGDELRALDDQAAIFKDPDELRFAADVLMQVGRELTPQTPLGFGDMAALIVFHNAAPNNTLPIFWSNGRVNDRAWKPLFPRA